MYLIHHLVEETRWCFFLNEWKKDKEHKSLILREQDRLVQFAKNYESFININFAIDKKNNTICEDGYDVASIIKNISRIEPSISFIERDTLILFDEIQDFPEIATALKAFCLDNRFDVICSGSMLGVNYQRIESNNVGYKSEFDMYSLDLEELLWAKGYGEDVINELLENMKKCKPFNQTTMSIFSSLFLFIRLLVECRELFLNTLKEKPLKGIWIYSKN